MCSASPPVLDTPHSALPASSALQLNELGQLLARDPLGEGGRRKVHMAGAYGSLGGTGPLAETQPGMCCGLAQGAGRSIFVGQFM